MTDPEDTQELRRTQQVREAAEVERARQAQDELELAQAERRAEKARYLREKLDERAEAEREQDS